MYMYSSEAIELDMNIDVLDTAVLLLLDWSKHTPSHKTQSVIAHLVYHTYIGFTVLD